MKYTKYLSTSDIKEVEYEVISTEMKIYLTRLLSQKIISRDPDEGDIIKLGRQNYLINKSRALRNLPVYILKTGLDGFFYEPQEYIWHNGEFEIIIRSLNTIQFIEFLGFLIEDELFQIEEINELLIKENSSFRFDKQNDKILTRVLSISDIDETPTPENTHPNIRQLVSRMDNALAQQDYSLVIHSSATIFETMAKDIIGIPNLQNQSLGGFFERYKNDSALPEPILSWILDIYEDRNTQPLAGHGSIHSPLTLSKIEATTLVEMTKTFVKIEYLLIYNQLVTLST